MSTQTYDAGMAVERKRVPRNLTLNPVLVQRLQDYGNVIGEGNLSRMVDRAIEHYLEEHGQLTAPKPAKPTPRPRRE